MVQFEYELIKTLYISKWYGLRKKNTHKFMKLDNHKGIMITHVEVARCNTWN